MVICGSLKPTSALTSSRLEGCGDAAGAIAIAEKAHPSNWHATDCMAFVNTTTRARMRRELWQRVSSEKLKS